MRFSRSGRKPGATAPAVKPEPPHASAPLTVVRVGAPGAPRDLGRRSAPLTYDRVVIPSLVLDHTELMLRQHGTVGEEGFGIWAGTLAGGDAFVSTLVIPRCDMASGKHGEVNAATTALLFERLDALDLVPIAQIHSHPRAAFLSTVDAQRPLVAAPGFLSLIVPDFGFIDLADVARWRAYEFHGRNEWRELDESERRARLIIDPSLLRIG
jgi:hypothetical protein